MEYRANRDNRGDRPRLRARKIVETSLNIPAMIQIHNNDNDLIWEVTVRIGKTKLGPKRPKVKRS